VAPETTVADVIAPFLAARGGGTAAVDVREALPSAVFELIRAGAADVGVSSGAAPASLAVRAVASFPIWAYVPPGHRWAERERVSIQELVEEPLIVLGPSHGTRRLLDAAVAAAGAHHRIAAETNVPQVAQALAAGGRGVAVVSDDPRYGLVPVAIVAGGLSEATWGDEHELRIPLVAAWDPSHYAVDAIDALVDSLIAYVASRRRRGAGG
jgi:DNA-binding transcriptional LysR family regulator